ncbi:DNA-directed RNA polymerase I subunit RPA34 [Aulostomus maculatus]
MPRDVSPSSSEDEADNEAADMSLQQKETAEKPGRYQCPADFVTFCHKPCSSTLTESLKSSRKELWLIKAPASFNPERVSGMKMNLSGLQTLKVPLLAGGANTESGQQIYSVLASTHGTSELRLLTSHKQTSDSSVFGPAFSGLLNVFESFGDSGANQAPQVIPAAPAPTIPPGLKQRFHPFGSKTPNLTCVAGREAGGAAFRASSKTLHPLEVKHLIDEARQQEEGGRKKRKKKGKRIKTEDEVVNVKEEPAAETQSGESMALPCQKGDFSEEKRRKKKRKKKDREEGEEPEATVKQEEETVKCEPVDALYGDEVDGSRKKKKKKKKSKTDDD